MKRLFFAILLFSSFAACQKEDTSNIDYFAFGAFYGRCIGDCTHLYQIKDGKIYPDNMKGYFSTPLEFSSDALPNEKYLLAKKLVDNFPKYLSNKPNQIIGCPNCADQGTLYIEIKENDVLKTWNIDPYSLEQPDEIQAYMKELQSVYETLRN